MLGSLKNSPATALTPMALLYIVFIGLYASGAYWIQGLIPRFVHYWFKTPSLFRPEDSWALHAISKCTGAMVTGSLCLMTAFGVLAVCELCKDLTTLLFGPDSALTSVICRLLKYR